MKIVHIIGITALFFTLSLVLFFAGMYRKNAEVTTLAPASVVQADFGATGK